MADKKVKVVITMPHGGAFDEHGKKYVLGDTFECPEDIADAMVDARKAKYAKASKATASSDS